MEKNLRKDEKKEAGANYIITFYNQVMNLNTECVKYVNFLVESEQKYRDKFTENATPEEKESLLNLVRELRYFVMLTYVQYKVISKNANIKSDLGEIDLLEKNYLKIRNSLCPNRDELQEYVISINNFLVKDIITELLTTSNDFVNKIYGAE